MNKKLCTDSIWAVALIVAAVFITYYKSLFFNLTYLDDNVWVGDYSWFLKQGKNIVYFFTKPDLITDIFYRPILNLSFMFNTMIGGENNYVGFHLTNIVLHVFNAYLVYVLLIKFGYEKYVSLICALIFSVHPALTASVAWIPGRTDSLLGLFVFSSFIFFIKFLEEKKSLFLVFHLILLICALLTKETAIVLPVLCFLFLFLVYKERPNRSQIIKFSVIWAFVIGAWFLTRTNIIQNTDKVSISDLIMSVGFNLPTLLIYLGKTIFPFNLSVLPIIEDSTRIYGVMTLAIIIVGLVFYGRGHLKRIIFSGCWFLLFLLPALVLSFIEHEYRLYIPMVGIMILFLELGVNRYALNQKHVFLGVSAIVVIVCMIMTYQQSQFYSDRLVFWKEAVKTSPHSPLAHRNLGAMHYLDGNIELAEKSYLESINLNPYEKMVHNNLGLIHAQQGNVYEAEREYLREIKINPDYDQVNYNLGLLYFNTNRIEKSEYYFKKSVDINPHFVAGYKMLANYYHVKKDVQKLKFYLNELESMGIELPAGLSTSLVNP